MHTPTALATGVHRPGYPFTAAELQALRAQGVLRHVLADVYAEAGLPDSFAIRAAAAGALLSRGLRTAGVLCGETAAWVHLGRAEPRHSSIITEGVYRRPTDGPWRVYQVPLSTSDIERAGKMPVTTPPRTAADIYCGIGTADGRRALDQLLHSPDVTDQMHYWPTAAEPLTERDQRIWEPSAADEQRVEHRMDLIGQLMHHGRTTAEEVLCAVLRVLGLRDATGARVEEARTLLTQCASRRLPTVR